MLSGFRLPYARLIKQLWFLPFELEFVGGDSATPCFWQTPHLWRVSSLKWSRLPWTSTSGSCSHRRCSNIKRVFLGELCRRGLCGKWTVPARGGSPNDEQECGWEGVRDDGVVPRVQELGGRGVHNRGLQQMPVGLEPPLRTVSVGGGGIVKISTEAWLAAIQEGAESLNCWSLAHLGEDWGRAKKNGHSVLGCGQLRPSNPRIRGSLCLGSLEGEMSRDCAKWTDERQFLITQRLSLLTRCVRCGSSLFVVGWNTIFKSWALWFFFRVRCRIWRTAACHVSPSLSQNSLAHVLICPWNTPRDLMDIILLSLWGPVNRLSCNDNEDVDRGAVISTILCASDICLLSSRISFYFGHHRFTSWRQIDDNIFAGACDAKLRSTVYYMHFRTILDFNQSENVTKIRSRFCRFHACSSQRVCSLCLDQNYIFTIQVFDTHWNAWHSMTWVIFSSACFLCFSTFSLRNKVSCCFSVMFVTIEHIQSHSCGIIQLRDCTV